MKWSLFAALKCVRKSHCFTAGLTPGWTRWTHLLPKRVWGLFTVCIERLDFDLTDQTMGLRLPPPPTNLLRETLSMDTSRERLACSIFLFFPPVWRPLQRTSDISDARSLSLLRSASSPLQIFKNHKLMSVKVSTCSLMHLMSVMFPDRCVTVIHCAEVTQCAF